MEPISVSVIDEPISKHSLILVHPHSHKVHWLSGQLCVCITQSLENPADIPQIEGVVGFIWSWFKWTIQYIIIDLQRHVDHVAERVLHISCKVVQKGIDDRREDGVNGLLLQIGVSHNVKVPLQSLGDFTSASSRRAHGGNEDNIFNFLERLLLRFSIVPATVVHELPQQF